MTELEKKLLEDLEKDIADDESLLNSTIGSPTSSTVKYDKASSSADEIARRGIEDIRARLARNVQRLAIVNEKLGIEEQAQSTNPFGMVYKGPIIPIIIGIIVILLGIGWYLLH